jgi:hypothetical protein
VFSAIAFGLGETFSQLRSQPFDIAYCLRNDHWRGENVMGLQVKAMRPTE